jgi:hypothetical protein
MNTNSNEVRTNLPEELRGRAHGVMSVATKTEKGFTLTKNYGFTIVEENGKVLAFDLLEHPELGVTLLFGNQVFVLKFWDDADLDKGSSILLSAIQKEKERRNKKGLPENVTNETS